MRASHRDLDRRMSIKSAGDCRLFLDYYSRGKAGAPGGTVPRTGQRFPTTKRPGASLLTKRYFIGMRVR